MMFIPLPVKRFKAFCKKNDPSFGSLLSDRQGIYLIKSPDACPILYYFSFRLYVKKTKILVLGQFQSMKRELQGQYVTI